MPEYLAPAVYVEEVDTGSKPIEGVSTSTAGMIGVTERGPANVPVLVTGIAEYQRIFGGQLNAADYLTHRYLPHAVEGFFTNGGKRVYVTRVLDPSRATPAERSLLAPDAGPVAATQLLLVAPSPPPLISSVVTLANPGVVAGNDVQIDTGVAQEFRVVAGVAAAGVIPFTSPLAFPHAAATNLQVITLPAAVANTLGVVANAGATQIQLGAAPGALVAGDVLELDPGGITAEIVTLAAPPTGSTVRLQSPLRFPHPAAQAVNEHAGTAGSAVVDTLPLLDPSVEQAIGGAVAPPPFPAGFVPGAVVRANDAVPARVEIRRMGDLNAFTVTQAAYTDYPAGTRIERVTVAPVGAPTLALTDPVVPGATVVRVNNRTALNVGDLLQVGVGAAVELAEIVALPAPLPAPNPGAVVLRSPLSLNHAAAMLAEPFAAAGVAANLVTLSIATVPVGSLTIPAALGGLAAGNVVRVTTPAGGVHFHVVATASAAIAPQTISLTAPLTRPHGPGALVARRTPMMLVRALDAGLWGNRLRVAMEPQSAPILSTRLREILGATAIRLDSAAGVEEGTELVITDSAAAQLRVKVGHIDRLNNFLITLEATTPLVGPVAVGNGVRSQEYRFVVELLRQQDPAVPSRNNQAMDGEVFRDLSLDPRHSRYFEDVIGCTWNLTTPTTTVDDAGDALRRWDRRSEGESNYVRVRDLGPTNALRPPPIAAYETRPDGTRRLILLPLANGDDLAVLLTDAEYVGLDNVEPEQRSGLFTMRNIEDISIIAAPGRTSQRIQQAMINHCELMRYRFAVLDAEPPPNDSLASVQYQRQQYDTKYAALYHPWLLIGDPFPLVAGTTPDYPIPPSGHMMGVYARTDIDRGVHKAPANEVIRGVLGVQRRLNKEQHDILNPFPANINVIRDFRPNNRGIRIYGGRVISSDSDWKYVNVRRLLIFIEASIDRGLQWVVFEPNAEPLWARVRRAISNFLTIAWRNGALEGTSVDEAFFVKCDRTTMTQTDIDSGRLIVQVGVAPVKPAEFVIVRIGLWTAHADE